MDICKMDISFFRLSADSKVQLIIVIRCYLYESYFKFHKFICTWTDFAFRRRWRFCDFLTYSKNFSNEEREDNGVWLYKSSLVDEIRHWIINYIWFQSFWQMMTHRQKSLILVFSNLEKTFFSLRTNKM
jgi:hypothetical protein